MLKCAASIFLCTGFDRVFVLFAQRRRDHTLIFPLILLALVSLRLNCARRRISIRLPFGHITDQNGAVIPGASRDGDRS